MGYMPCMENRLEIPEHNRRLTGKLTAALKCHPILSTLLINRNITDRQSAIDFLQPALKNLRPPDDLCDISRAVQRISAAIENSHKILVFGDYDVDGVTATCLLTEFLEAVGADVSYYIPHRVSEGYSLSTAHIHNGAVPKDTGLIITVDCGVSSRKAVAAAAKTGIDVIVTDHHSVTLPLPEAIAVINPNRADCPSGLGTLSGVGVVFYLVIALRKELRAKGQFKHVPEPNLKKLCDLVALGTVADMVPIVRENRILTSIGLDVINSGGRPGLNKLTEASRIRSGKVNSEDIAFRLAPRLNAAGRLNHASESVELLRAIGNNTAGRMATALNDLNSERRKIERATSKDIEKLLSRIPDLSNRPAIVLSSPDWHPGITGIVAARLAKQYHRPALLVSMPSDIGKGSGRSIPGIDIIGCLDECAPLLERYGGHPAAAGITVTSSNFDAFKVLFEESVQKRVSRGIPPERIRVDCELDFGRIRADLLDALSLLEPFGQGNPEPLFVTRHVSVLAAKTVGKDHSRLTLSQQLNGTQKTLAAIYFNSGTVPEKADQVVYALRWNHWNGRKSIQAVIKYME
ncbi:MAG: single-stranded-DNA-specific exonuclease RecJ [Desulfobacterales bacterium]|nr:single-stranded-DNA-specific exonuclease RecJ [Desulfobacterales bacterium]